MVHYREREKGGVKGSGMAPKLITDRPGQLCLAAPRRSKGLRAAQLMRCTYQHSDIHVLRQYHVREFHGASAPPPSVALAGGGGWQDHGTLVK